MSWIQRAFPRRPMETRFYVRVLLRHEYDAAKQAVLRAIETEWKFMPTVYELSQALPARVSETDTCHHDISFFERCPWCIAEAEVEA